MEKKCKNCEKVFIKDYNNQNFCSNDCYNIKRNIERRKQPKEVNCLICNISFSQKRKDNLTCSSTCGQKLWVKNNPNKNWERNNSEEAKKRKNEWVKKNPDKIKKTRNKYKIKRYKNDYFFKLKENIRNLIRGSFYKKAHKNKTLVILGCSYDEFRLHLESKFEPWMNWDNYGNPKDGIYEANKTWDIDHIIAISTAKTEEDITKLNHYTNLQPLCSYNNRWIKKDN